MPPGGIGGICGSGIPPPGGICGSGIPPPGSIWLVRPPPLPPLAGTPCACVMPGIGVTALSKLVDAGIIPDCSGAIVISST